MALLDMVKEHSLQERMGGYFADVQECMRVLINGLTDQEMPRIMFVSVDNDQDMLGYDAQRQHSGRYNDYIIEVKTESVQNYYSGTSMNYINEKAETLFKSLYTVEVTAKIWSGNYGAKTFDCVEISNFLYQAIKMVNDERALSGKNYELSFKESSKMVVDYFLSERGTKIQTAIVPLTFSFFREFTINNRFKKIKEIKENKIKAYEG